MVLEETREEVAELGVNPDDPRLKYDLTLPDAKTFRKNVMASARAVLKEESDKTLSERIRQELDARQERTRRESGVDSHDTAGTVGQDDKAFMRQYAEGKSDDHKRAQKILKGK